MQLLIDSTKLEALLQRKQAYIGYKKLDQSCNVANALVVMYGGFSASPETSLWANSYNCWWLWPLLEWVRDGESNKKYI